MRNNYAKRKTKEMMGKDSLTRQKCCAINYGIISLEVLYKRHVDYCLYCHHYFMDLKSWQYFKVEYMTNQIMIFSLFLRKVALVNNLESKH